MKSIGDSQMKILLVSDSHRFLDHLPRIVKKYKGTVDLMIHCGDSALPKNDKVMKQFDIAVEVIMMKMRILCMSFIKTYV